MLGVFVWLAMPAAAQDRKALEDLERRIEQERLRGAELARQAEALEAELAALRQESVTVARGAQGIESRLIDIETLLAVLTVEESRKATGLRDQRERLTATLIALQRIALQPAESALAGLEHPLDRLRVAGLLGTAASELESRATALQGELEGLATLRAEIDERRAEVETAAADLDGEKARLAALADRKQQLFSKLETERDSRAKEAADLASQARDLKDLVARLEVEAARRRAEAARWQKAAELAAEARERRDREARARQQAALPPPTASPTTPPATPPAALEVQPESPDGARILRRPAEVRAFPKTAPGLVPPVRGSLVVAFGERSEYGFDRESKGVVLAARAGGQVVAPYDGQVVYAGPFRRYGLILIIEHDGRYHSLLAGMNRVDAVVGQWVLAGEPVGTMGGVNGDAKLYLELRQAGQPVDPNPWLMASDDKARG